MDEGLPGQKRAREKVYARFDLGRPPRESRHFNRVSELHFSPAVSVFATGHREPCRATDLHDRWAADDRIAALDVLALVGERQDAALLRELFDRALGLSEADRAIAAPSLYSLRTRYG